MTKSKQYSTLEASSLLKQTLIKKGYPVNYLPVLEKFLSFKRFPEKTDLQAIAQSKKITKILSQLENDIPVEYITREASFYGLSFAVSPSALIPRPLTEELVTNALAHLRTLAAKNQVATVLDIGTGSGAIIIALAHTLISEFPNLINKGWQFIATDISKKALKVAVQNAVSYRLANIITFVRSDIVSRVITNEICKGKNHCVIISNPPYIKEGKYKALPRSVKEYEPKRALVASPLLVKRFIRFVESLHKAKKETALFLEYSKLDKPILFSAVTTTDALRVLQKL